MRPSVLRSVRNTFSQTCARRILCRVFGLVFMITRISDADTSALSQKMRILEDYIAVKSKSKNWFFKRHVFMSQLIPDNFWTNGTRELGFSSKDPSFQAVSRHACVYFRFFVLSLNKGTKTAKEAWESNTETDEKNKAKYTSELVLQRNLKPSS